jgi:hypothetical protein
LGDDGLMAKPSPQRRCAAQHPMLPLRCHQDLGRHDKGEHWSILQLSPDPPLPNYLKPAVGLVVWPASPQSLRGAQ